MFVSRRPSRPEHSDRPENGRTDPHRLGHRLRAGDYIKLELISGGSEFWEKGGVASKVLVSSLSMWLKNLN
jgi:hypothetical protein